MTVTLSQRDGPTRSLRGVGIIITGGRSDHPGPSQARPQTTQTTHIDWVLPRTHEADVVNHWSFWLIKMFFVDHAKFQTKHALFLVLFGRGVA